MSEYITYQIIIEQKSGLSTPLQADTIWGHLASYMAITGYGMFNDFLDSYRDGCPPVIFSDGLPALADVDGVIDQYVPKPFYPAPADIISRIKIENKEDRTILKRIKKLKWINVEVLQKIMTHSEYITEKELFEFDEQYEIEDTVTMKNMVPRFGCEDTEIYSLEEVFIKPKGDREINDGYIGWVVYCKIDADRTDELIPILERFLEAGYGKKKGIGKGQLEVKNVVRIDINDELDIKIDNPNAFISLSSFVPAENDPVEGWYQTFVKYGKLGETAINMDLPAGAAERNPFKNPVMMFKPGAVFRLPPGGKMQDYYGVSHLPGVRYEEEYVHPALAFVVPYRIEE
ncbi:MAG TPA: hypothetical protein DF296_05870 [Candidatus Margulisbacteria bacterium]|nr:MAG: hypothetical protein A2X42_05635 [Candidatus Margulisbacteria bacterium GWF2_38_17]HCT84709.1 hypothetical protein [Candidatus Margulisiibacteriota bacterium]